MTKDRKRPEWAPAEPGEAFASEVREGVCAETSRSSVQKRKNLSVSEYVKGVRAKDRTILARAITLIESNAAFHQQMAQEVLHELLPFSGHSIRVGITGVPGVGKSTFIERLGCLLCELGHKVAVLAVDPSSTVTGGSILGDKTRMEKLIQEVNAFIRPSPSGGTLGGVARKSRETILLCEAAGFDVILVETVGVGQSEVTVRSMTDFFLLLLLADQGDELQGIKKGTVELADAILVNKAEGEKMKQAELKCIELQGILRFLQPVTEGWSPTAGICSAETGMGIREFWKGVEDFCQVTRSSGVFEKRRREQAVCWLHAMVREYLGNLFYRCERVEALLPKVEKAIGEGEMTASVGLQRLIEEFKLGEGFRAQ